MLSTKVFEGEELALAVAGYADEMQAENVTVLDLRGISSIADYFVICTGTSTPHLKAIRREVGDKLHAEHDLRPRVTDGSPESQWLILDYVDVLVHIFHTESRDHYSLEELWSDAVTVPFRSSVAE